MKAPRLAACFFGDARFRRMAAVLEHSARRNCPDWTVDVVPIQPELAASPLGIQSHSTNTAKLDWWAAQIEAAEDDDRVLLIDGDTMVLRDLTPAWDRDFDLGYTTKTRTRYPFNGGVVLVRVNARSRAFVAEWRHENGRLFNKPREHQIWRSKFGGINQASFGMMLETGRPKQLGLQVVEFGCPEWNCEDSCWPRFDPAVARIVHIKSQLRREIWLREARTPYLKPIAKIWRALDAEASPDAPKPETIAPVGRVIARQPLLLPGRYLTPRKAGG